MSEDIETKQSRSATIRTVAPLFIVNALAVYGQLAYALDDVAPAGWPLLARIALAIGFATAVESVALYVGWHAHDALLLRSHATARQLRRWSFLIAGAVAAMNYTHFTADWRKPTAAACAFGLLSLLSPWMWGLHTRRAARLQLLKEQRADGQGAEFSSERRRAFPILTWQARRWSIMNNVHDPIEAWTGYLAERKQQGTPVTPAEAPGLMEYVTPVRIPSVPRPVASTSGRVARWDVEKAVALILDGKSNADIMDAIQGLTPKPLQRTRRCAVMLQSGMDESEVAKAVSLSPAHVQRIRAAMLDAGWDGRPASSEVLAPFRAAPAA